MKGKHRSHPRLWRDSHRGWGILIATPAIPWCSTCCLPPTPHHCPCSTTPTLPAAIDFLLDRCAGWEVQKEQKREEEKICQEHETCPAFQVQQFCLSNSATWIPCLPPWRLGSPVSSHGYPSHPAWPSFSISSCFCLKGEASPQLIVGTNLTGPRRPFPPVSQAVVFTSQAPR